MIASTLYCSFNVLQHSLQSLFFNYFWQNVIEAVKMASLGLLLGPQASMSTEQHPVIALGRSDRTAERGAATLFNGLDAAAAQGMTSKCLNGWFGIDSDPSYWLLVLAVC